MNKRKAECTPEEWEAIKAKCRAKQAAYRARNPELYRARNAAKNRAWREKNPEASRAAGRRFREAHPGYGASARAKHLERMSPEQKEKAQQRRAQWKAANPEKCAHYRLTYRLRQIAKTTNEQRAINRAASALVRAVEAALPSTLPAQVREDAKGEALCMMMAGECLTAAEAAKAALRKYWRQYNKFGVVSLDENLPGTVGIRRIETIPSNYFEAYA